MTVSHDLTRAVWKKSSKSAGSGQCVETALNLPGIVAVRDSKDPHGPALLFSPAEWSSFILGTKLGDFDQK